MEDTEQRHTEEIQDIIGAPPPWLLKWGITLFFLVLVLILAISEVIRYPDVVKTQLTMRAVNLPQPVIIKSSGVLITLLVQNNRQVKILQTLATIKSDTGTITLKAPLPGKLTYAGILHQGQQLSAGKTLFHISNGNEDFFGEMPIPQNSNGKVKDGMEVIIKVKSYPYEEYGMLHGYIKYIADNPAKNGEFLAEVDLKTKNMTDMHRPLALKPGMIADARIITENNSLFKRLTGTLLKNLEH